MNAIVWNIFFLVSFSLKITEMKSLRNTYLVKLGANYAKINLI